MTIKRSDPSTFVSLNETVYWLRVEFYEVKYFLAVAGVQNIHRASERMRVSPASLSKAIRRLETQLDIKLFERAGRGIRLTPEGKRLKLRGEELVRLEEQTRAEVSGKEGTIHVLLAGPETLLSTIGIKLVHQVQQNYPDSTFQFSSCDDASALKKLERGDANVVLTSAPTPTGLTAKVLGETSFQTYVGSAHPLHHYTRSSVKIEELLRHPFVSPASPIFGALEKKQSLDGWRDDKFPRKITYTTESLSLMIRLVEQGAALAYLPRYLSEHIKAEALKVRGCPYTCEQAVKLVAVKPHERGWLQKLFLERTWFKDQIGKKP